MSRRLSVADERWSIRGSFTISRGSKTEAHVIVATIEDDGLVGRGEAVPYARYGESVEQAMAAVDSIAADIAGGLDRDGLVARLPAGAARNAVDCALWDLEAKKAGVSAADLAGVTLPDTMVTAFTLGLGTPDAMAEAARQAADRPLLKLKLGGGDDLARVAAVRAAAPDARLVVDANEAWSVDNVRDWGPDLAALGVEMIEQPVPADADEGLTGVSCPVALCADESCHGIDSLDGLLGKYQMINIKLDKTGGLTEALRLRAAAEARGLGIMVGCMLATSLAMAPAMLVASSATVVDLDGPLLLAEDRQPGLHFDGARILPPPRALWG